jgi:hypothetical protein
MEGDADVLKVENLWGRLLDLIKNRRGYVSNLERVAGGKAASRSD